ERARASLPARRYLPARLVGRARAPAARGRLRRGSLALPQLGSNPARADRQWSPLRHHELSLLGGNGRGGLAPPARGRPPLPAAAEPVRVGGLTPLDHGRQRREPRQLVPERVALREALAVSRGLGVLARDRPARAFFDDVRSFEDLRATQER